MRKSTTFVSILLSIMLAFVTPAFAQDVPGGSNAATPPVVSDWTVDVSVTAKSGREFLDQGFLFTSNDVVEFDATFCKDGLCFNFWRADTRVKSEHETDFQVWKDWKLVNGTVQLKAALYEVAGPDIYEAKATYTLPVNEACAVSASYERMWRGFKETVAKAKARCSFEVSDRISIDVAPQITHTKNFDQWVPGAEVGVNFGLGDGLGLRPFGKAYGGREPEYVLGGTLSWSPGRR